MIDCNKDATSYLLHGRSDIVNTYAFFFKPLTTQPALLHQPLVRSQSGIGRGNVFLHLVQLASESAGDEINVDLCQRII